MRIGKYYPNTRRYLHAGYKLVNKVPLTARWILMSMLVFTFAGAASYTQSMLQANHAPNSQTGTGYNKPSMLQEVSAPSTADDSSNIDASNTSSNTATNDSSSTTPVQPPQQSVAAATPAPASVACTSSSIPYQTSYVNNPSLPQGQQNITTNGIDGYTLTCPGQPPQTVPAQNEVVSVGTAPPPAPAPPPPPPSKTIEEAQQYCKPIYESTKDNAAMAICMSDYLNS